MVLFIIFGFVLIFLSHNALSGDFFSLQIFCLYIMTSDFILMGFLGAEMCQHLHVFLVLFSWALLFLVCLFVCFPPFVALSYLVFLFYFYYYKFYSPVCFPVRKREKNKGCGFLYGEIGRVWEELGESKPQSENIV